MYSNFKKFFFWVCLAFVCALVLPQASAQVPSNTLKIGDQTDSDKTIEVNIGNGSTNPKLIYNTTDDRWQFTNDGVNVADLGSGAGGGGGTNLLVQNNFNFEAGLNDWTNSGSGTFVSDTSTPLIGEGSAVWTPAALDDTLDSVQVSVPSGFFGRTCTMTFLYNWDGVEGEILAQVYDGTDPITSTTFPATGPTNALEYSINFDCPVSGTMGFRLRSTAASAAIEIDEVFVGQGKNVKEISQANFLGTLTYPSSSTCTFSATNGSLLAYPANGACGTPTVKGSVQAPGTKIPAVVVPSVGPGKYEIVVQGDFRADDTALCKWEIFDGTNFIDGNIVDDGTFDAFKSVLTGTFEYTSPQGDLTFEVFSHQQGGTGSCDIRIGNLAQDLDIYVKKYPLSEAEAVTLETSGQKAQLFLNGSDTSLTTNTVEYPSSTSLTLTKTIGNMDVNTICSDGTSGTTTCSTGDELLGFEAQIKISSDYLVCTNFNSLIQGSSGTMQAVALYRLNRVNTGAVTTLEEGEEQARHLFIGGFTSSSDQGTPVRICNIFSLSPGAQRFAINADTSSFSNATATVIGSASFNVSFSIFNLSQQFPTPVFTDLQNSLNQRVDANEANIRTVSAHIDNPGTPTINEEYGNWIDSITDNGVGDVTINVTSGVFSGDPNCVVAAESAGNQIKCRVFTEGTNSAVQIGCSDAAAAVDADFYVTCDGPK